MSELLNTPVDWQWNGKTYKVCKRDITIEGQFADWVMMEAALAISRLEAKGAPPLFIDKQNRLFNSKVSGKKFRWDPNSEDVNEAAWSEEGKRQMLWLKIMRGAQLGGATIQREEVDIIASDTKVNDDTGLTNWQRLLDILYQQDYPDFFVGVIKPQREEMEKTRKKSDQTQPEVAKA